MGTRKMKRIISLLFLFATTASAHVHLLQPLTVAGPNGVITISAPDLTCNGYSWQRGLNGAPNQVTVTYAFGTATSSGNPAIDSAFVPAPGAPTLTNTLNLTSCTWALSLSGAGYSGATIYSGTLSGPQCTGAVAAFEGPQTALFDFADYFLATWQPSHSYTLNTTMIDPAGHLQKCTTAGTSGASLPASFNDSGGTTTDGTVVWTDQGLQTALPPLMGTQPAVWGSGDN